MFFNDYGDGAFKSFLADSDEPAAAGVMVGIFFALFRPTSNRVLACRFWLAIYGMDPSLHVAQLEGQQAQQFQA